MAKKTAQLDREIKDVLASPRTSRAARRPRSHAKRKSERDPWGEDAEYPVDDWKYEVANDDTRRGYWDWVDSQREAETT